VFERDIPFVFERSLLFAVCSSKLSFCWPQNPERKRRKKNKEKVKEEKEKTGEKILIEKGIRKRSVFVFNIII
jgi:hypothetical protein